MRHSRSPQFDAAWPAKPQRRWGSAAVDPNNPRAIAHRARLGGRVDAGHHDRIDFLCDRCAGKNDSTSAVLHMTMSGSMIRTGFTAT